MHQQGHINVFIFVCVLFAALQTPGVATVEMMQCISQAVPLGLRKPKGKDVDAASLLMQLPHFDADVVRKLKRSRVSTLKGGLRVLSGCMC